MVSVSSVGIANMALSHVGARAKIQTLTENSAEAKQCNIWYDFSRTQALEAYDWAFARKRLTLALDGDAAPDEWSFRYQYPADCVAFRRIWNPNGPDDDAIPFAVETNSNQARTILTNLDSAVGVYTFDLSSTVMFTPFFVEALSHLLAHHIAFSLTGKLDIKNQEMQIFNAMIRQAGAANANEAVDPPPRDAEWVRGR